MNIRKRRKGEIKRGDTKIERESNREKARQKERYEEKSEMTDTEIKKKS